jgi:DNA-binding NarL/FixJ family response regulator
MNQQVRVLIADDQRAARQGLKALLTYYPQVEAVGEAANGQDLILLIPACQPDVVLMDMQMPVMDGLQATRNIKRSWPHVKVIALTMYNQYKTEALAAGVDAFLIKGCATETLLGAILSFSQMSSEKQR